MATLTAQTRNSVTLTEELRATLSFLLKQDDFYLLLETGDKIILEPLSGLQLTAETKN